MFVNHKFTSSNLQVLSLFFLFLLILQACATSPEEKIKAIAESTQKACPLNIDEHTVMQKAEALLPEKTLKFTYTLKGTFGEDIKKEMSVAMKPILIERLQQANEYTFYLENEVNFEHLYLDTQGNTVMQITLTPLDYK